MANANPTAKLRALRNIIALEQANDFQDRAVSGGLDRFLATLSHDALHPAVRSLAERGMLHVDYGALDAERRRRWAEEVERLLSAFAPTPSTPKRAPARRPPAPKRQPAPPSIDLDSPVVALRSVNATQALRMAAIGVKTVRDLVWLFPNRHLDYSQRCTIAEMTPGVEQTIVVELWDAHELRLGWKGKLRATEAVVGDDTGNLHVIWFGQWWVANSLKSALARAQREAKGKAHLVLSGKMTVFNGRPQMESPEWEVMEDPDTASAIHTGRLVPVYPGAKEISTRAIRRMAREALDAIFGSEDARRPNPIDEPLPDDVRGRHGLMPIDQALLQSHYPDSWATKEEARHRLAFDELLVYIMAGAARRQVQGKPKGAVPFPSHREVVESFLRSLPFELTGDQKQALEEAMADMGRSEHAMSRLLQGDVGSGKTVVALALLLLTVAGGYQGAIMAPTEVLAEQHYLSVQRLLGGLTQPARESNWFTVYVDPHPQPVSIGLLTGSTRTKARRGLYERVRNGTLDILIGTHALIQEEVEVPRLALAVVDEQHRFGVAQRAALRSKGASPDVEPHQLVMSATPIPRTLSLTLYGDLEMSTIREMPAGRRPIQTRFVPPERRDDAERFLVTQAQHGRQSFVVCPLIEESEAVQSRAATEEYERLRQGPLRSLRVGLLHGRMPVAEKQSVMEQFRAHQLDVLVATSVIEVGIDVPNATVMLIEGAERFGLAQLHQLRGRVGRGAQQSFCLLAPESLSDDAQQRLEVIVQSNDGFEIADADLRQRGPGDFFGTRQSGLPTLRMARLDDGGLLPGVRDEARAILARDPELADHPHLAASVRRYTSQITDELG